MANLTFVNILQWVPDQVANWLRGLDDVLLPYVHFFLNAGVTGKQLLFLNHGNLRILGVEKLGHRELILEAVEMMHSLYYDLEQQTIQSLSLQLSCKSCSLRNEIIARLPMVLQGSILCEEISQSKVPVSVLTGVSDIISSIKQIVSWLDRSPFDTSDEYIAKRDTLIGHGMDLLDSTQKEHPLACEKEIMDKCRTLAQFADKLIQECKDPLIIQPVSLEITTIRKKPEDDLGMHIQSLYNGTHIIGGIKDQSPADLCGKVEEGDEVIQVNYQTVVGWHLNKLVAALKDNKKEVTLTLKKRPHHVNPFGPHLHKRKVPKNVKQSTFPKAFRRKSREEKSGRAPLKDFLNSMPAPYTKDSSQEPDSDNENEVFQTIPTTPCLLPLPLEPAKQRRATVSGGSPPSGKRNSLEIGDLTTSGRPKSYTISSPSSEVASLLGSPASDLMSPKFLEERKDNEKNPTKQTKEGGTRSNLTSPEVLTTPPDEPPLPAATVTTTLATAMTTTLTITPPNTTQSSEIIAASMMKHSNSDTNMQLTIPSLEAQTKRRKSDATVVSVPGLADKGSPQLLRVTRINSQRRAELYDQGSSDEQDNTEDKKRTPPSPLTIAPEEDSRPESFGQSYTVNIVGGVARKVASQKDVRESPTQSPSGLLRRKHFMKHITGANRRISCKDLGGGDCQGWLWKKKEGIIHGKWVKRWFILKQKNLYYYKGPDDDKAQGVIHLPGFKVSPAPEIKSKKFAFKCYHTGTTFYFASERQSDMGKWMNKMGLAAIVYDTTHITTTAGFKKPLDTSVLESSAGYYSESDEENDAVSQTSGYSTPTSPPTPKRGTSPVPSSTSSSREDIRADSEKDDLVAHFAHIRRANVDLDGHNAHDKRASTLSKAGELDITNSREVELHRKLHSLCRTLKVKERELDIIQTVMHYQPITSSILDEFKHSHPDIVESLSEDYSPGVSSDGSISESDDL